MKLRLSPRGDIKYNVKQIFSLVSKGLFSDARESLALLRADLLQYYISRDMDTNTINGQLNRLQIRLEATHNTIPFKQKVIYKKLREIIKSLDADEQKPSDKYEHLLQIYADIQNDVEQFAKSKRYEDAETIRGDFTEIRNLDDKFQTDHAEYKLYQDIMRQIGLCTGTIMRLSFEKISGSDAKKMYVTFENLFPKIESLVASKKFREEPKDEKPPEELADTKIKEIKDLMEQGMNAEQIVGQAGVSPEDVESIVFEDEKNEG